MAATITFLRDTLDAYEQPRWRGWVYIYGGNDGASRSRHRVSSSQLRFKLPAAKMVRAAASLAALALASGISALPLAARQVTCVSGVYIISARGSNEDPGEGKVSEVSTLIKNAVPDSVSVAVDYPAAIISSDSTYPASVTDGINDTIEKIHSYVDTCGASSKIVLLGYSQGGNVHTDVLAGGVDKPDPLTDDYRPYSKCSARAPGTAEVAGMLTREGSQGRRGLRRPQLHGGPELRRGERHERRRHLRAVRGRRQPRAAQHVRERGAQLLRRRRLLLRQRRQPRHALRRGADARAGGGRLYHFSGVVMCMHAATVLGLNLSIEQNEKAVNLMMT
ncbi:MAG: cutinase family protein [Terriglobus roseus]|nr:cutinase family protein [Terriglobus roseus]